MFCQERTPSEAAISFAKCVVDARAAVKDPNWRWTTLERQRLVRQYENRVIECARMQMLHIARGV